MLSKSEKREFIRDLLNRVKASLLAKVNSMPEDWNGGEIRQLIADFVADEVNYIPMTRQRKRSYKNERLTRNL